VKDVLAEAESWLARGARVALATVVATRRSAPRPVGAKLAVSAPGDMAGSVSGGCVENDVYEHAKDVLRGSPPRLLTYGISDELALSVGLPCGGEIDVFVDEADPALLGELRTLVQREERAVLFTVVEGEPLGARSLARAGDERADEALASGRSHLIEQEGARVFADVFGPPPRLLVFGAVDTAEELCRLGRQLGWRTIVADPRAKFATPERLPSADELIVAWPEEALGRVRPGRDSAVVVLTHDDKFDVPALKGALESEAFYIGALGSRRNQARRRERLLDEGVHEDRLDRIAGPCGLDIGADTPAETALSIMAEILARRVGRSGGPLRDASGRIHAEVA
jgi:xanthine dehydrogenase accessory factor